MLSPGGQGTLTLDKGTRVRFNLRPVAEGGFSYIYRATDSRTREKYALKRILFDEQKELALSEMHAHREFRHPNIMPLLDSTIQAGPGGHEYAYLLFPWVGGGTLRDWIDARVLAARPPSDGEILAIFEGVCQAARELHSHDPPLAHRDIKPDNVMLADRLAPIPILTDLGSVAPAVISVRSRAEALAVQDETAQFCTLAYRAPELFDVASSARLDARTDVWSLGCLLFAMAFGYSPFECEFSVEGRPRVVECSLLRVIGPVPFPAVSACSAALRQLMLWMLEQDPQRRPTVHDVLGRVAELRGNGRGNGDGDGGDGGGGGGGGGAY
ncbi:unnamed protein product, partial [Phaeothamnion confervicola]